MLGTSKGQFGEILPTMNDIEGLGPGRRAKVLRR
jgi:hypothetical protein